MSTLPPLFALALTAGIFGPASLLMQASAPLQATMVPLADPSGIAGAVAQWTQLRSGPGFGFDAYAQFLIDHPGWPGESAMRKSAEAALSGGGASPDLTIRYFTRFPPLTATGGLRLAQAYAMRGNPREANEAARQAWRLGALSAANEAVLLGQFGNALRPEDYDARVSGFLWARNPAAARPLLPYTSSANRGVLTARVALVGQAPDAMERARAVEPGATNDAGFLADRAYWYRRTGQEGMARQSLARPYRLAQPPADARRWLDILYTYAKGAADDGQYQTTYDIARQLNGIYPPGTEVRNRPIAERDLYTNLAWLAGRTALKQLGRPRDAQAMFLIYAQSARTQQVRAKGFYWAGRAADAAGNAAEARGFYQQAAQMFDQFYGQLAAERIGVAPTIPAYDDAPTISPAARTAYARDDRVRAADYLGRAGRWSDQSAMLKAMADSQWNDGQPDPQAMALGFALSRQLGRPDFAVMIGRNTGVVANRFTRSVFPTVPVPPSARANWTMCHAITRQESQFDRRIVSRAGARGMMQLMPGTAREVAGKIGMAYSPEALFDPLVNIEMGSFYYQQLYNRFGNHALAVAAYNAGGGNVSKWLAQNGDPRGGGVDMIEWIESIPFTETRGYVQRVLENAVVYEQLAPNPVPPGRMPLSRYLGRSAPAG